MKFMDKVLNFNDTSRIRNRLMCVILFCFKTETGTCFLVLKK